MQKFSMEKAIRFGWDTTKSNIGFFIGIIIVGALIGSIINLIPESVKENLPGVSTVVGIVSFVINIILEIGVIRVSLKFCDKEKGELSDFKTTIPLFFKFVFGTILYALIVIGGMILLIVPGIIWGIKFQYFGYLIIDENLDPIDALKKSSEITSGAKWDLFLFNMLLGVINIIGFFFFIIGLFVSIPTTILAFAHVYRKLLSKSPIKKEAQEIPKIGW